MEIKIKKLQLTNFKCFQHIEIVFNDQVTTIRGRNGVGKTTIADAILWCLFGKNTQGQADFDLKTHDENGRPIPNLEHAVEATLDVDGKTVTLRRTLKENWVKRRGTNEQVFKNNTTEYLINGEVTTATDYKKYISELVSEDIFRAITNPAHFPSLKWQEQRQFLANLAGNIDQEDITAGDKDLQTLSCQINNGAKEDIIAYRKHLSYQIKQLKDKLDRIPVRLEEQNKALPEQLDWLSLVQEQQLQEQQLKNVNDQIIRIRSGNGQDLRKETMRKELDELFTEKRELETQLTQTHNDQHKAIDEKIAELTQKFSSLLNNQRDLEASINSFDTLRQRSKTTAEQTFKSEQAYIREHWAETQARFGDTNEGFCPICGQKYPEDKFNEAKKKFNLRKAELKQQLNERADKAKQLLAEANQQAEDYEAQKAEAQKKLEEAKEHINNIFSEKQKAERKKAEIPTFEQLIEQSERHRQLIQNITDLQREIENAPATSEADEKTLANLETKKKELSETIATLSTQLATKQQYDRIQTLIAGIKQEQHDLITQLSELERKEDIARRYQDRQNAILEERINNHFTLVQWRMFRTVNNAGDPFDEPYCECYVGGVAYHDGLNQAARLNAGLDIINTLCVHYNVSAPIVIDNSESNLDILQTPSQQIRLQVADTDLHTL